MYGRRRTKHSKNRRSSRKGTSRRVTQNRYRRPKRIGTTKTLRPKWINPLSESSLIRFTYTDSGFSRTLNVAGGFCSYYVFRANSLYDPDYTGVGAQPYGYDQYFATGMYTNYRVTASAIRVYFRPDAANSTIRRLHAVLMPFASNSPTLLDISDVRMIPYHKETTYDGLTETTRGARLKHYMTMQKFVPTYKTTESSYQAAGGNPTLGWYWIVYFYTDELSGAASMDVVFDVKIKYYAIVSRYSVPDES